MSKTRYVGLVTVHGYQSHDACQKTRDVDDATCSTLSFFFGSDPNDGSELDLRCSDTTKA